MKRPFIITAGLLAGLIGTLLIFIMPAYLAKRSTIDITLPSSVSPSEQVPTVQPSERDKDIDRLSELARTMLEAKILSQESGEDEQRSIQLKGVPKVDFPQITDKMALTPENVDRNIDKPE